MLTFWRSHSFLLSKLRLIFKFGQVFLGDSSPRPAAVFQTMRSSIRTSSVHRPQAIRAQLASCGGRPSRVLRTRHICRRSVILDAYVLQPSGAFAHAPPFCCPRAVSMCPACALPAWHVSSASCSCQYCVCTGDGSSDHLEEKISAPGSIKLEEGTWQLGRCALLWASAGQAMSSWSNGTSHRAPAGTSQQISSCRCPQSLGAMHS